MQDTNDDLSELNEMLGRIEQNINETINVLEVLEVTTANRNSPDQGSRASREDSFLRSMGLTNYHGKSTFV